MSTNFSSSSIEEVAIDYAIGKNRDVESSIYQKDCETNITDIGINSTQFTSYLSATHDSLTLHHSIDKSAIGDSSIWNETSTEINVCQVVRLFIPESESGGLGKMVIAEDSRQLNVKFDLSADFNFTTGLAAGVILNETAATDVSNYLRAYKCTSPANFAEDDSALNPNQELFICVIFKGPEVNVESLESGETIAL